jgi:hypothetical protein
MTFNKFKTLADLMVAQNQKVSAAYKLNIDLLDFNNSQDVLISNLWSYILTDHGKDWFDWFMYEKNYIHDGIGNSLTATDDGKPICEDLQGLYDYLVENNYFKIPVEDAKTRN